MSVSGTQTDTIFIAIPCYRDPELDPTVQDCIANATHPERLRFGICWSRGESERLYECFSDPRVRVAEFGWRDSYGGCWARAEAMKLWQGEDWYLQLDSHHRFAAGWDELLIEQAALSGSDRPVLSTLAPGYTRGEPTPGDAIPYVMTIGFESGGIPFHRAAAIDGWETRTAPLRGRFTCGHFLFAPGSFIDDVPHDPEVYGDEEMMVTLRAFTHGYELFVPSAVIVWHDYSRQIRPNHYDDHVADREVETAWHELCARSRERTLEFLRQPWRGRYGVGSERSVEEYEAYAGISLRHCRVQDYTRANREPSNPPSDPGWVMRATDRHVRVVLDRAALPVAALEAPKFWYVGFHASDGAEIFRQDACGEELVSLLGGAQNSIMLSRSFESEVEPVRWTVIPFAEGLGWLDGLSGDLCGDYLGLTDG
jgi:hypothetical protein